MLKGTRVVKVDDASDPWRGGRRVVRSSCLVRGHERATRAARSNRRPKSAVDSDSPMERVRGRLSVETEAECR